jgi:hypothetical protein
VNGDGLDDVLYRKPAAAGGWSFQLSDGVNLGPERNTRINPFPDDAELGVSHVNLDRDSTVDVLVPIGGPNYVIGRGTPSGTFQTTVLPSTLFTPGSTAGESDFSRVVALGDLNGDALPDLAVRQACRKVLPREPPNRLLTKSLPRPPDRPTWPRDSLLV